jgi:acyl-coenzyme A thioesterase PaaI-like protein
MTALPVEAESDPTSNSAAATTPARLAAARALRTLNHTLVAHHLDDAFLAEVTAQAEHFIEQAAHAPPRTHAFFAHGADFFAARPSGDADAEAGGEAGGDAGGDAGGGGGGKLPSPNVFPDNIVSGPANPMGLDARLVMDGQEAVMTVTLGAACEGAPGRAHGGVVAALLDDTLGMVLSIHRTPAFTGRLALTYRAPTPLGVPLTGRARLTERRARTLTITGELRHGDLLLAEAEGTFIAVDPSHFLGEISRPGSR